MELTVFSAGIHSFGQVPDQFMIQISAGEMGGNPVRIGTNDAGAQTSINHFCHQVAGILPPEWEDGLKSGTAEAVFAVSANVFKK